MQSEKKTPVDILETISDTLEERKGRDRRRPHEAAPYLNPSLERRKGADRRDEPGDEPAQE